MNQSPCWGTKTPRSRGVKRCAPIDNLKDQSSVEPPSFKCQATREDKSEATSTQESKDTTNNGTQTKDPDSKLVVRVRSQDLDICLHQSQLWRMYTGCTSLPYNAQLANVGMTHTVLKRLSKDVEGDVFQRHFYYETPDGEADLKATHRVDLLSGPVEPLNGDQTRVVIFKQKRVKKPPPPALPGSLLISSSTENLEDPENVYQYIHCIYDFQSAVFIDDEGHALFVKRDQLTL